MQNINHKWIARVNNVFRKTGCPHCKKSRGEELIAKILNELKIDFEPHFIIKYNKKKFFYVDFYLEKLNLIIEYNGIQHYKPVEIFGGEKRFKSQLLRDKNLRNYCYINKIKLLELDFEMSEELIYERVKKEVSNSQLLLQ